jgi:hypothetical protein
MTKLLEEATIENAAAMRMALRAAFLTRLNVILTSADRLGAQYMIKFMATWILVRPLPDRTVHISLNFNTFIPNSRVMESPENVVNKFVNRHSRVVPSIQNSSREELEQRPGQTWR